MEQIQESEQDEALVKKYGWLISHASKTMLMIQWVNELYVTDKVVDCYLDIRHVAIRADKLLLCTGTTNYNVPHYAFMHHVSWYFVVSVLCSHLGFFFCFFLWEKSLILLYRRL